MPQWELCTIDVQSVGRGDKTVQRFIASTQTSGGLKPIDLTPEFIWQHGDSPYSLQLMAERDKLIGRLLEDGWEPFLLDSMNLPVFKRSKPDK